MKRSLYMFFGISFGMFAALGHARAEMRVIESNTVGFPIGTTFPNGIEPALAPGERITVLLETGETRTFQKGRSSTDVPIGATMGTPAPR